MTSDDTQFQFLTENSVDIICRAGTDRRMHYVSPSSYHLLGWRPEEMVGAIFDDFVVAEDLPLVFAAAARSLAPGVHDESVTVRMLSKDKTQTWMEVKARVLRNQITDEPQEYVVVMRDVTERKLLEERLSLLALTDGLTGLANRRAFDEALHREWRLTLRAGTHMSLMLLDVDHFKRFNDHYGHQVGDDCLRSLASAVNHSVRRDTDLVARYGGEEIAIILPATDMAGAVLLAEQVRDAIQQLQLPHVGNPEGHGYVSASIGVATCISRDGGTMSMPEGLLQAADNALYKAKYEGRNRVATTLVMAPQDH